MLVLRSSIQGTGKTQRFACGAMSEQEESRETVQNGESRSIAANASGNFANRMTATYYLLQHTPLSTAYCLGSARDERAKCQRMRIATEMIPGTMTTESRVVIC